MKKILISLSYYAPHLSGLTRSTQYLAERLAKTFALTVLTTQYQKELPLTETIQNVQVIRVPFLFRLSKGFVMPEYIFQAISAVRKTDHVFIVLPQVEGFLLALIAAVMGKKIHCLYVCEVSLSGGVGAKLIEYLLRFMNVLTLALADSVSTLTDDFAKHNFVLEHVAENVKGIYPIVQEPTIDPTAQADLRKRLPKAEYYIGYLGRMAAEKGIAYLLEAIPLLQKELGDSFKIILAGPEKTVGEEAYQQHVKNLLEQYKNFVVPVGELPDASVGAFYSLLDVFVLPSTNNTEAFGMVQVESMYCGTPVVATDLPGVRVPIQKTGMGEVVPSANTAELARAIAKIIKNKRTYLKPIASIEKEFSAEKIVEAYKSILA